MSITRRRLLQGIVAAPAIVQAENIMPLWVPPTPEVWQRGNRIITPSEVTREALVMLHDRLQSPEHLRIYMI